MNAHNDVTVIIPAYNEQSGIEKTLNELFDYTLKLRWRLLVIDDGSTDNTSRICNDLYPKVETITHPYNKGYGAALKTGILSSETEYIALYDADGQHNAEDLVKLFNNMANNDMVVGARGKDSYQDWIRKPGKWILKKVANFLTDRKIPDLNSGLRVIRRSSIVNILHLFPDGFSFSTTSTIAFMNLGLSVSYHPIKVNKRTGTSTVKQLHHGSQTLLLILRLIVLFNPLKVFIPISFALFGLGAIYEVIYGLILPQGIKVLPAAILLILSGIVVFFFGLLVDQVSEMRKHMYQK